MITKILLSAIIMGAMPLCADEVVLPPQTQPSTRPSQVAVIAAKSLIRTDLPYAGDDNPERTLDVYAPKNVKGATVVMFVHGGEWSKGDKSDVSSKPKLFNESGMVFISVNYRLSPGSRHPAQVNDVAAAVRWAVDHVAEYGGDPKKIVLVGHSAGCHLVTLVTLDPRPLATVKLKASDIAAVVSWSGGAFDLVEKAKTSELYGRYIRVNFGLDEAAQRDASPMNHVGEVKELPKYLFASIDSNPGSQLVSEKLAGSIRSYGGDASNMMIRGKSHFNANHELGAADDETGPQLISFIQRVTWKQ